MEKILPGFWYLNKKNNKSIKNLNILTTDIYKSSISNKKIVEINKLYLKLLKELSNQLNLIHKKKWTIKTWEIIIGSWLKKYITVISNRLQIIEYLINKNEIFFFINSKNKQRISLNTYDMSEFIERGLQDDWNEEIFTRIYNFKKYNTKLNLVLPDINLNNKKFSLEKINHFILNYVFKIYNYLFCRKSRIVLHKPYFGKKIALIKFQLSLKEFPILYSLDNSKVNCDFDIELRRKIKFRKTKNSLENLIKKMAIECIPKIYLEGFASIVKRIEKSSLPQKKTVIFSSNLHNDSIFKFWTAIQRKNGSKLLINQHGSEAGFFKFEEKNDFYHSISDLRLTWGWSDLKYKNKIKKFSITNHKIFPEKKTNFSGGMSIVMNNYENYIMAPDHNVIKDLWKSEKNKCYFEMKMILDFLDKLKPNIISEIVLRPHPKKNKRINTLFFEKKCKEKFKVDDNFKIDSIDFIRNFNLNIIPEFHSTTFAFAMAKNFPVIAFFPHDTNYFNLSTKKIFRTLVKANICHTSPESASNFINKIYGNSEKWWYSKKTQQARKKYCNRFARVISNRAEKLKEILFDQKKKLLKEV